MKKLKETQAPLLNRTEMIFELDHFQKSTPKKEEIKKQLATELKVDEDVIKLNRILTNFGASKIKVIVDVYKTKEDLQKLVRKKKKAKKEGEQTVAPTPQQGEVKPAAEKKEEVTKEVKEKKEDGKEESKEQKSE